MGYCSPRADKRLGDPPQGNQDHLMVRDCLDALVTDMVESPVASGRESLLKLLHVPKKRPILHVGMSMHCPS